MRVTYIEKKPNGKIARMIGPLENYQDYIVKLDLSHRRSLAEIPLFGRSRRMKFGLWCEKDAKIPWIEEEKQIRMNPVPTNGNEKENNIQPVRNIQPGDYVINTMGICGDQRLKVISIDEHKGTVQVEMELFGEILSVQMDRYDVEKISENDLA